MTEAEILQSLVKRIEAVREEKKLLSGSERDLFAEAKGKRVDGKALRRVPQRRAMDDADREAFDDLVDQYEAALGNKAIALALIKAGASVRSAAKKAGIGEGTARRAKKQISGAPKHDPETGEITETPKSSAAVASIAEPLPGADVEALPTAALGTSEDDPWLTAADLRARLPDDDAGWQSRDGHEYVLALQVANGKEPHPGECDTAKTQATVDALRKQALIARQMPDSVRVEPPPEAEVMRARLLSGQSLADLETPEFLLRRQAPSPRSAP